MHDLSFQAQQDQVEKMLPLAQEKLSSLSRKARHYVEMTLNMPLSSPEFHKQAAMIHTIANTAIKQAAQHANHLLNQPLSDCQKTVDRDVGSSLLQLRSLIEDLSPTENRLFTPKKLFGFIPWGNQVKGYFARYESVQSHLNTIPLLSNYDEVKICY